MIRLIAFIIVFVVFLGFIVLNLQNRSDISFGVVVFPDVPVFVSILCSFMLGMLFSIPLAFSLRRKKQTTPKQSKKSGKPSTDEPITPADVSKENTPYGID